MADAMPRSAMPASIRGVGALCHHYIVVNKPGNELQRSKRIKPREYVIHHDTETTAQLAICHTDWLGFEDIEQAKQNECQDQPDPAR